MKNVETIVTNEKLERKDIKGKKEKKQKKAIMVKEETASDTEEKQEHTMNGEQITPNSSEKKQKKKKSKKRDKDSTEEADDTETANDVTEVTKKKKRKKDKKSDSSDESESASKINGHAETNGVQASDEDDDLPEEEKLGKFSNFRISTETVQKLKARGVRYLFPIQAQTFNHVYDRYDVMAQARTGTGKTFSFGVPLVEKLHQTVTRAQGRPPQAIVLEPTRELARQVNTDFEDLSDKLAVTCIYGGAPYDKQEREILRGIDVLTGTPGRILDFVQKGTLDLSQIKHVVLDEVDRMLDMGFADMVDEILQARYSQENKADNPQTLLFSATMPPWVYNTAKKYFRDDVKKVDLVGSSTTKTATTVQHLAIKCGYHDRASTIGDVLKVYSGNHGRAMVFCQTKRDADELVVSTAIKQETHVMHGDIPQDKREMVLKSFREGRYKCLVTTDVAARGLDIPEVDLVIQCSPPKDVDSYIHRSGRTGRAGRVGTCVLFYKPQEEYDLQRVERQAGVKFKKVGAPSPEDIIQAAANDASKALEEVGEEMLKHFQASAERLIAEKGPVQALAAALAVISGSTEIQARSLLNSAKGFTTYLFRTNTEMNYTSYCWKALQRYIPEEVTGKILGMKMCADKMGAAFDLPTELDSVVEDRWKDGKFDSLQKATELPELQSTDNSRFGSHGGFRGGRGGGFNSRGGSFNNRGGGFNRRGGNFSGGGFRGQGFGSSFGRGQKRSFEGSDGGYRNKITKFE